MRNLIAALAVSAASATSAQPAAPCGEVPICPPSYPREAQGLQNDYRSSISTPEQRAKMLELIARHTVDRKIDWESASRDYYQWLSDTPPRTNEAAENAVAAVKQAGIRQRELRATSEDAVRRRLIDPQSAQFEWPFAFVDGWWKPFLGKKRFGWVTCGYVNSRNRMGGYVGRTAVAVVIDKTSREASWVELGDSTRNFDLTTAGCQKLAKNLPGAMAGEPEPVTGSGPTATISVADEIAKLAKLRDQGLLTEAEFQAQKSRLLNPR